MIDDLPAPPLSIRQVADYLGCAPATVRRLIKKGDLRAVKVGGRGASRARRSGSCLRTTSGFSSGKIEAFGKMLRQ
jgi:excisionase family DNA binding protein